MFSRAKNNFIFLNTLKYQTVIDTFFFYQSNNLWMKIQQDFFKGLTGSYLETCKEKEYILNGVGMCIFVNLPKH